MSEDRKSLRRNVNLTPRERTLGDSMLKDSLAALVNAAPPDATVTVRWLAELLASEGTTTDEPRASSTVDLTVSEVAARFGKGQSTVRTWLARGELSGAYRLHGKEWRIPLASIEGMQRSQAEQHSTPAAVPTANAKTADIGAWRKHLKAS